MIYDAAIVIGTGIKQNGVLPDSCLANINTAISLYKNKEANKLIFSGKWAWNCKYQPPFTEAYAMKLQALEQSVSESHIFVEQESVTTVSNLCRVKSEILIPQKFLRVILVIANEILKVRSEYNLQMVLGPGYTYEVRISDFVYPADMQQEISAKESQKITDCQRFYHGIAPGDHELISQLAQVDLDKNYLKK